ncbi:hypothetical protein CURTO8I2_170150 [Curtobacterium sp. 8I-2]|nr:hypothetical protein CURTO8I2_170150 [Curtobacterium sp. 8I-2]
MREINTLDLSRTTFVGDDQEIELHASQVWPRPRDGPQRVPGRVVGWPQEPVDTLVKNGQVGTRLLTTVSSRPRGGQHRQQFFQGSPSPGSDESPHGVGNWDRRAQRTLRRQILDKGFCDEKLSQGVVRELPPLVG